MRSTGIRSHLKKKKGKKDWAISSFKIDRALHTRLMKQLRLERTSLHDLIVAAAQQYLGEKN